MPVAHAAVGPCFDQLMQPCGTAILHATCVLPERPTCLPISCQQACSYAAAHRQPEGMDYTADPSVHRPAALTACSAEPVLPEAPGFGISTYRAELLHRSAADLSMGSSAAASCCRGVSAPGSPVAMHAPAAVRPGYLTTSAAASLAVAERYGAPPRSAAGDSCSASCAADARQPASGSGRRAGSAAVFNGSQAAACFQDPPAAWAGPVPDRAGGAGMGVRPSKDAAYLRALDQHSRGRLPGYTGHRPQHDVALELPPPSKLTTWGAASQEALRRQDGAGAGAGDGFCQMRRGGSERSRCRHLLIWYQPDRHLDAAYPRRATSAVLVLLTCPRRPAPPAGAATHGSKSACLAFFSGGSAASQGFVSENGLADAARFHETTRPLEGRMKVPRPSNVSARGARFAN